jgi:hypothetical protein
MTTAGPKVVVGAERDDSRVTGVALPPGSSASSDKGAVTMSLSGLRWNLRGAPAWVRASTRWWGDEGDAPAGAPKRRRAWARLATETSAELTFPVRCKPAGFARYCRDARAVVIEISDGRTARVIAECSVDVSSLDVHHAVNTTVPLCTRAGSALGALDVRVAIDYVPGAVSSFEMNEHMSRVDDKLPLAPPPSTKPLAARRRAEAEAEAAHHRSIHDVIRPPTRVAVASVVHENKLAHLRSLRRKGGGGAGHPLPAEAPIEIPVAPRTPVSKSTKNTNDETNATPSSVLELAERLAAQMDDALAFDARALETSLDMSDRRFDRRFVAPASPTRARWWGDVGDSVRASTRSDASGASGVSKVDNYDFDRDDDDAALCADEAILRELFFVDDDGEGTGRASADGALLTGPTAVKAREEEAIRAVASLADEAEAELARDVAITRAARARDGLDETPWDAFEDVEPPVVGPVVELRLTAHSGLVRALDVVSDDNDEDREGEPAEGEKAPSISAWTGSMNAAKRAARRAGVPESLVVVIKAGYAPGELGRVVLEGLGPKGAGVARVRLTEAAAAELMSGEKNLALALELWTPDRAANAGAPASDGAQRSRGIDTAGASDSAELGARLFGQMFGDFERADPDDMHGIAAVPLAELARDLGRDLGGRNAADDDEFPLNRVFEVRNPISGDLGGYIGVEARVLST